MTWVLNYRPPLLDSELSASRVGLGAKHKEPSKPCGLDCGLIESGLFDCSEIYEKTQKNL
jgi:hypothetical protein